MPPSSDLSWHTLVPFGDWAVTVRDVNRAFAMRPFGSGRRQRALVMRSSTALFAIGSSPTAAAPLAETDEALIVGLSAMLASKRCATATPAGASEIRHGRCYGGE